MCRDSMRKCISENLKKGITYLVICTDLIFLLSDLSIKKKRYVVLFKKKCQFFMQVFQRQKLHAQFVYTRKWIVVV